MNVGLESLRPQMVNAAGVLTLLQSGKPFEVRSTIRPSCVTTSYHRHGCEPTVGMITLSGKDVDRQLLEMAVRLLEHGPPGLITTVTNKSGILDLLAKGLDKKAEIETRQAVTYDVTSVLEYRQIGHRPVGTVTFSDPHRGLHMVLNTRAMLGDQKAVAELQQAMAAAGAGG